VGRETTTCTIVVCCLGGEDWIPATVITKHEFDVDTVLEYMGPNGPASMPYAHSDLLSFNKDDIKRPDQDQEKGPIKGRYPMVRK